MVEFEFDVQTLLDANLHFYWSVRIWFSSQVGHYEFFFLSYPVVISIDDHVDVVSQIDDYAIVCLKLLFHPIELKIV